MKNSNYHLAQGIQDFLKEFHDNDPQVQALLAHSVGRVAAKMHNHDNSWKIETIREAVVHIADWLKSSLLTGEAWLAKTDDLGRPRKLMKCGTIDQLVAEADKATVKAIQKATVTMPVGNDEAQLRTLEEGFTLVHLLTSSALDREGLAMQHCIGNGAYDDRIQKEGNVYVSLRDRFGRPHATLEISDGVILQLQGKQNRPPKSEYTRLMLPFFRDSKLDFSRVSKRIGYVSDNNGNLHDVRNIPDGVVIDGDVEFNGLDFISIPENLTINGSLSIRNTSIKVIPESLSVKGSLYIERSLIVTFPKRLRVYGNLSLDGTLAECLPDDFEMDGTIEVTGTEPFRLPESLTLGGSLYLKGMRITAWPSKLKIGNGLFMQGVDIDRLPSEISVGGSLDLRWTKITALPSGLSIGGSLFLQGSAIKSLPSGLSVAKDLHIEDTRIEALPDDIRVGDGLFIDNSLVMSIPRDLTLKGPLSMNGTKIRTLPSMLKVGTELSMRNTPVTFLPADLEVGRRIDIRRTSIDWIPERVSDDVLIVDDNGNMPAHKYRTLSSASAGTRFSTAS